MKTERSLIKVRRLLGVADVELYEVGAVDGKVSCVSVPAGMVCVAIKSSCSRVACRSRNGRRGPAQVKGLRDASSLDILYA
jgi:hypothetical protein